MPQEEDEHRGSPPVLNALDGLFASHEVKVLGAVGLLTGSICVFFVKMLHFLSPIIGVAGIGAVTAVLLLLDPQVNINSIRWWGRLLAVLMISIIITSPQLYDAWTVAATEEKNKALAELQAQTSAAIQSLGNAKENLVQGTIK